MKEARWNILFLSVFAAVVLASAPVRAQALTTTSLDLSSTTTLTGAGDDLDNDGVSDVEDNCPGVADATQDDLDGDGEGDVCDSTDATLDDNATVKVVPSSATSTGSLTGKGTFTTTGAEDDSVDNAGDLTIEVTDADGMDETVDVSTDDCGETEDGGIVQCTSPAATVKISKSSKTPGGFRYTIKLRHVGSKKAPVAPVTMRLRHGAHKTDRVGELATCTTRGTKTFCSK